MLVLDYPTLSMKYMNMHVKYDCMDWNVDFSMISACNEYGMVDYKSDMKLA